MPIDVATGALAADQAIVWVSAPAATFEVRWVEGRGKAPKGSLSPDTHTGQVTLTKLRPDTDYVIEVRAGSERAEARFHTPPRPNRFEPARFAWGGDLGGQNACRDTTVGYPVFAPLNADPPDLFIAVGDLIYADGVCDAVGRHQNAQVPGPPKATNLDGYGAWWRYNLADAGFARLRATVAQLNVWDDHEVVNDFGPETDMRDAAPYEAGAHLMPLGLAAMRAYNPMPQTGPLYRSVRWGKAAEIFLLDVRSYRSPNDAADGPQKTMLGAAQEAWLAEAVPKSDAVWKIVVTSSPLAPPSGIPTRDGWAADGGPGGFVTAGLRMLETLSGVQNLVFLSTDVHFATANRLRPFAERPTFAPVELISGPLHAGMFPTRTVEARFGAETLWFQDPPPFQPAVPFAEALHHFNVGRIEIGADRALIATWVAADGTELARQRFEDAATSSSR